MSKPRKKPTTAALRARRLPFHWSYFLLAGFLVFFSWKYIEKTHQVQALARQEAGLRYVNNQVQADNARTERAIANARTMQYVQETARALLGYTLPGETSVMLSSRVRHGPGPRHMPTLPAAPPVPPWRQWWNSFFG